MQTAIEDIERIRKFYKVSNWIVGGHSWGANIALVYALKNPDYVNSIIYIAGNGIHNDRHWSDEYHDNKNKHSAIVPDVKGAWWFFERYCCSRFDIPDDKGNIILDICHFIK